MPSCNRHDEPGPRDMAEKLGRPGCKTPRPEKGYGRIGTPDLSDPASYMGRRDDIPNGCRPDNLIHNALPASSQALEVPQGRGSDDVVVWTVADNR